jgi:hypothetical protein
VAQFAADLHARAKITAAIGTAQALIGGAAGSWAGTAGQYLVAPLGVPVALPVHIPDAGAPGGEFNRFPKLDEGLPVRDQRTVTTGVAQLIQQLALARMGEGHDPRPSTFAPA